MRISHANMCSLLDHCFVGAGSFRVAGPHGEAVNEPFGVSGVDVGIKSMHGLAVKDDHVCGYLAYVAG